MYEGYRKIKKLSTEFRQGIENSQRVSEMLGGYRKYQEGIENVQRVSENLKTKQKRQRKAENDRDEST